MESPGSAKDGGVYIFYPLSAIIIFLMNLVH